MYRKISRKNARKRHDARIHVRKNARRYAKKYARKDDKYDKVLILHILGKYALPTLLMSRLLQSELSVAT
jgi:hypothetical protein